MLGPFSYEISRIDDATLFMVQLFLGSWNTEIVVFDLIPVSSAMFSLVLFVIMRYFLILMQIINLASQFSLVSKKSEKIISPEPSQNSEGIK